MLIKTLNRNKLRHRTTLPVRESPSTSAPEDERENKEEEEGRRRQKRVRSLLWSGIPDSDFLSNRESKCKIQDTDTRWFIPSAGSSVVLGNVKLLLGPVL